MTEATITTTPAVDALIASLSQEDLQALLSAVKVTQKNESAARRNERDRIKGVVAGVVNILTREAGTRQTFTSGAQGWSLGGTFKAQDGNEYKVSILMRDVTTIPAKDAE